MTPRLVCIPSTDSAFAAAVEEVLASLPPDLSPADRSRPGSLGYPRQAEFRERETHPVDGLRSIVASVQQTLLEAGAAVDPPTTIATAAIAVRNPLAGRGRVEDLGELEALGRDAAALLVERALAVLATAGVSAAAVRGYGKGAIVGIEGDREHTAAVLHPRFGAPVRAAIGGGADIIPGTKKVAGPGAVITMPIGNKDDRWVFDDMDAVEIALPDAPRPDEIVIALALSAGGRPNARVRKPS